MTTPYKVILSYGGIDRTYWCEHHYDTVVLFDALYRGARWHAIQVVDTRTGLVMQEIRKPD